MTCSSLISGRALAPRPASLLLDHPCPKQTSSSNPALTPTSRAAPELILTPPLAGSRGCWSRNNLPQSCEEASAGYKRSSRRWEGLSPLERKARVRQKLNKELFILASSYRYSVSIPVGLPDAQIWPLASNPTHPEYYSK